MVLFRTRIRLDPSQRVRVVRSLIGALGATRVLPGCIRCRLFAEIEDTGVVAVEEEWLDEESLRARLRGDLTPILLAAIDCAKEQPEIRFETITDTKGMELIAACRGAVI